MNASTFHSVMHVSFLKTTFKWRGFAYILDIFCILNRFKYEILLKEKRDYRPFFETYRIVQIHSKL